MCRECIFNDPYSQGQCNLEHATCIDPVTDRIIFVDPQHINPLAWLTIQMTAMSFDQCDSMKWWQNQMLNCLTITAVDVNEERKMFSQKVSNEGEHDQKRVLVKRRNQAADIASASIKSRLVAFHSDSISSVCSISPSIRTLWRRSYQVSNRSQSFLARNWKAFSIAKFSAVWDIWRRFEVGWSLHYRDTLKAPEVTNPGRHHVLGTQRQSASLRYAYHRSGRCNGVAL